MNKDLSFLRTPIIAHRGMHDIKEGIPENSLKAFEKAISFNLSIEFDLHILKDGSIVVFHDDNLKRMTGIDKSIKDVTYDEIKDLKLQNTDCHIPLFQEVLNLISGQVAILIELKTDVHSNLLCKKTIKILENYKGNYAIQSFSSFMIFWLKNNCPSILRGQLSETPNNKTLPNRIVNFFTKPDFLSYSIDSLPNKMVEKFRTHNIVLGWTIRTQQDLYKARKYCDNFICENIDDLIWGKGHKSD